MLNLQKTDEYGRIIHHVIWSVDFDGKSIFELMEQWPKMPFAHIKMVVAGEGGFIDADGIIHRGTASYKIK